MLVRNHNFTVGADPEVFVTENGKIISAHGLIEGTKDKPLPVNKGAVQVDGMALEFNIDPADNFEEFSSNLDTVSQQLKGMIGDKEFCNATSAIFDEKYLESLPEEATELGCDPDWNAYTMSLNPPPDSSSNMRCTGGHVHIGGFFTDDPLSHKHLLDCSVLTRWLDVFLGQFSLFWDDDDKRRELYGKAGAFRPKPYGMEYRTLSNKWMFDYDLRNFIYRGVEKALHATFRRPDFSGVGCVTRAINCNRRGELSLLGMEELYHQKDFLKERGFI